MYMEKDSWWTAPAESEDGRLIMVTGRRDVEKFRSNPRFGIRIEVIWKYEGDSSGMPDTASWSKPRKHSRLSCTKTP